MDITCDIIRDLLPLYAEDMASPDSKTLVDEHLCDCDACTDYLGQIKKETPVPMETNTETLGKVRKTIRRRRVLSVMAALLTLITLASFVITWLFAPFQLTMEQALDDFYVREDGAIVVDYSSAVVGRVRSGNGDNWYINQYSTRYDMWRGENRKTIEEVFGTDGIITEEERQRYEDIEIITGWWQTPDGKISSDSNIPGRDDDYVVQWESEKNWWYADPRGLGNDTLIHDAGKEIVKNAFQFNPVYPMFFFGGIAASALLYVLYRKLQKPWAKELSARLAILGGSCAFSMLLVSSGRIFTSDVGIIDQYWGPMLGVNTVFLTLTVLFWRQLYLLNRQDKAI